MLRQNDRNEDGAADVEGFGGAKTEGNERRGRGYPPDEIPRQLVGPRERGRGGGISIARAINDSTVSVRRKVGGAQDKTHRVGEQFSGRRTAEKARATREKEPDLHWTCRNEQEQPWTGQP